MSDFFTTFVPDSVWRPSFFFFVLWPPVPAGLPHERQFLIFVRRDVLFPGNIVRMRRNLQGGLRFRVYL